MKHFLWTISVMGVGVLFAFLIGHTAGYEKIQTTANTTAIPEEITIPEAPVKTTNSPGMFYFIKDPGKTPKISAESYFVGDLDTGEVIMQKNKDHKFPIASVSKLMTALVSRKTEDQKTIIQIPRKAIETEGQNGELSYNEKIKTGDLIYPLLLESSNDAAEALAMSSDRGTFIENMNKTAKDLGLLSTSFSDPTGLSEKNVSTVLDLFRFTEYLKKNMPDLLSLTTEKSYKTKNHVWFNTSQFLGLDGYLGGKRGYIDESKQTALSAFSMPLGVSGNRNIGIIVLRSPDRYKDVESIYNYLKKNVYYGLESDANLAWVKQKEGVVEEREPDFVTLLFGGDIMLDRGVRNSVMKNFGGDYSALFNNLGIIKKSDIAFANLEGPVSDKGIDKHNLYSFRMSPSVIPALKGAGLSVVSVANNHVGDWGRVAYADMLSRLEENEILYAGGGMSEAEAEKPAIINKYGMEIGYLGFSDVGPDSMAANDDKAGLLLANNPRFDEIIQNASKKVDYLIVSFHFGEEYQTKHNARQEYLARRAIDDGAKIVIGSHPHVAEDTEVYRNGYIAYSLGNLIFDQAFSENTMQGMLLQIKLHKDGSMAVQKNTVKLNKVFQPEKVILGKEEKIKFEEAKTP